MGCCADGPANVPSPVARGNSYDASHKAPVRGGSPVLLHTASKFRKWHGNPATSPKHSPENHGRPMKEALPAAFLHTDMPRHHRTTKKKLGRKRGGSTGVNLGKENYLR